MNQKSNSFLRYPGGKRRMLSFLRQNLPSAESISRRYVEPFVGGGAVFFSLNPPKALLSDINSELIDLYCGIRSSPQKVWQLYCQFGDSKGAYLCVRDEMVPRNLVQRAARTLYLNRTCFKGMWRHNRKGEFNVGYGGQARRWVISEHGLMQVSKILRKAIIQCSDFEGVIGYCLKGDFVFIDPPYCPGELEHRNQHYGWQKFTYEDYLRLAQILIKVGKRGVDWAMTTSSHQAILGIFSGFYGLEVPCGTGRMPGQRLTNSGEILITNYKTKESRKL